MLLFTQQGISSLHETIKGNVTEKTKLLLKNMLYGAAYQGDAALIMLLLKAGIDKEARDTDGQTPLHIAGAYDRKAVVQILLENGADKEAQDKDGLTVLHKAAYCNHREIVELLLKAGASAAPRDKLGKTPLTYALSTYLERGHLDAAITIHLLLLVGNASLEKESRFCEEMESLLKLWNFDVTLTKRKVFIEEQKQTILDQLQRYQVPKVIALLIIEYHDCLETRMLLFKQLKLDAMYKPKSTWRLKCNGKQSCVVQ